MLQLAVWAECRIAKGCGRTGSIASVAVSDIAAQVKPVSSGGSLGEKNYDLHNRRSYRITAAVYALGKIVPRL